MKARCEEMPIESAFTAQDATCYPMTLTAQLPHEDEHPRSPLQDAVHLYDVRILDLGEYLEFPGEELLEEVLGRLLLVEYLACESHLLGSGTVDIVGEVDCRVRALAYLLTDEVAPLFESVDFGVPRAEPRCHLTTLLTSC